MYRGNNVMDTPAIDRWSDHIPQMPAFDDDLSGSDMEGEGGFGSEMIFRPGLRVEVIQLEPELRRNLSRRSRRRLRTVLAGCKLSAIRLDGGNLYVQGTEAAIMAARLQLETLIGPRVSVPRALWAELMRTRMHDPPSVVSVKAFNENTDCRVHIERGACEVRLYGMRSKIVEAQAYLEELGAECDEEVIPLEPGAATEMPASLLQWIGSQYGVTVAQEDDTIVVLGLHAAVDSAAQKVLAYVGGQKEMPGPDFVEDNMSQISTMSTLPPLLPREAISPMRSALLQVQQQPQLPPQQASQQIQQRSRKQRQRGPSRLQPSGSSQQPQDVKEHCEEWRQQRTVYHNTVQMQEQKAYEGELPHPQPHSDQQHFQNEPVPSEQQMQFMQMQGGWMPQQPIMFVPYFPQCF